MFADGDRYLAGGDASTAVACYTTVFGRDAEATVHHLQRLGDAGLGSIIAVLESWCAGQTWVPPRAGCTADSEAPVSARVAAGFLLQLEPGNLVASVLRVEALLRSGQHDEAVSRCNVLLNAHPRHSLGLLLTRALAWILSDGHSGNGVVDYMQAFAKRQEETVAFVKNRQKHEVPRIVGAFNRYLSLRDRDRDQERERARGPLLGDCRRFLAAITASAGASKDRRGARGEDSACAARPRDSHVDSACAARQMAELPVVESAGSEGPPPGLPDSSPRYRTSGLVSRAAAQFAMGSHQGQVIGNLASAFEKDPVLARKHLERLFSPPAAAALLQQVKRFIEAQLAEYRETVRRRPDLRSDTGSDLLLPVLDALQLQMQLDTQAGRDTRIRLADCRLLTGDVRGSLALCQSLATAERGSSYPLTVLALRAICHLHAGEQALALADCQAIVEHELPHPDTCVRAMCGRGLLRLMDGKPYLAALDYITASRLRLNETAFFVKAYVPWNQRGLLYKVLQEEGEKMVRKKLCNPASGSRLRRKAVETTAHACSNKER